MTTKTRCVAGIVIAVTAMSAIFTSGCEELDGETKYSFKNASSQRVVVTPAKSGINTFWTDNSIRTINVEHQSWNAFALEPGEKKTVKNKKALWYTYSPQKLRTEKSKGTINFYDP